MNVSEIQRIVLLVALGVMAYLLVQAWNADYGQSQAPVEEQRAPLVGEPTAPPVELAPVSPGAGTDAPTEALVTEALTGDARGTESDVPDASLLTDEGTTQRVIPDDLSQTDRLIRVETPVLRVWIDRVGGDIVGLHLPQYPVSLERPDVATSLLDLSPAHTYVAQSGLIGRDGPDVSASRPVYESNALLYEISDGEINVDLTYVANGVTLVKRFEFVADSYLVNVSYQIENRTSNDFVYRFFAQLKRDSQPVETASDMALGPRSFLGVATTTDESRYEKFDFEDLEEEPLRETVQGGWIAFLQHYFLSAWVADPETANSYYGERRNNGLYVAGFIGPETVVAPGAATVASARFYAGPKDQKTLEEISPNLNLTIDYGFLWWLAVPLFYVLDWVHGFVGNWGVAIILLTVIIKLVLFPLSAAAYKSTAKMRKVTPQLKRLQERHGSDRQKLSQEMMALYKKEGANPVGGCLPMLLQMPVFISLYWVLYESVELRQAPFFLWIHDLAAMDPFFVLPILMGVSMYGTTLLNPPMPDPMQQKMMKMMPIIFTVLFVFFPSGLVLYWLVNNILSFAQQYYVTKRIEAAAAH